jgi:hypothetical protein
MSSDALDRLRRGIAFLTRERNAMVVERASALREGDLERAADLREEIGERDLQIARKQRECRALEHSPTPPRAA